MTQALFIGGVLLAAAGLYGLTGFGFGLIAVPALSLLLEPAVVVPLTSVVTLPLSLGLAIVTRRHLQGRLFLLLLGGALLGIPLGGLLLQHLPARSMAIAVGLTVVLFSLLLLFGWSHPVSRQTLQTLLTGGFAGALGAAMGIPGPPVILFLVNRGESRDAFRANLIAFFAGTNTMTVTWYGATGLLDKELLLFAAELLPVALVGIGLGVLLARRVSETRFRNLTLGLVGLSGAVLLISNLF